jgi:uncharacterized phage protein (TIGR01671 family)
MREIKFRAWDKVNKRMELIDGCNLYLADGRVYEVSAGCYAMETTFEKEDVTERYIPLQYTGLKDKNGEEIYEGDIVHCKAVWDSGKMVVIWEEGEFHMVLCEKYKDYLPLCGYHCIRNFAKEVIGNIYENPDLLA